MTNPSDFPATVVVLAEALTDAQVDAVARALADAGADVERTTLAAHPRHGAADLTVTGLPDDVLRALAPTLAAEHGVDVVVVPQQVRGPGRRLVVMDVDSTLIREEVVELLAAHAGREAEVAAVTAAAMRGELDFAASLHARVATLAGLPVSVLDAVRDAVTLTPGARTLVATLLARGDVVALVSGGFAEVVRPLAASIGVTDVLANRLDVADGHLRGRVVGPVVDRAAKAARLRELAAAHGIEPTRVVAIGDGANDLDMLAAAGLGVAFRAKPAVRAQADAAVEVLALDAVLSLLDLPPDADHG